MSPFASGVFPTIYSFTKTPLPLSLFFYLLTITPLFFFLDVYVTQCDKNYCKCLSQTTPGHQEIAAPAWSQEVVDNTQECSSLVGCSFPGYRLGPMSFLSGDPTCTDLINQPKAWYKFPDQLWQYAWCVLSFMDPTGAAKFYEPGVQRFFFILRTKLLLLFIANLGDHGYDKFLTNEINNTWCVGIATCIRLSWQLGYMTTWLQSWQHVVLPLATTWL